MKAYAKLALLQQKSYILCRYAMHSTHVPCSLRCTEEQCSACHVQLLKRLDSGPAVNGCMAALVAGDLMVAPGAGASRADCLLPLYVPGERAHERHAWLSDILIALLQRAQVRSTRSPTYSCCC